MKDLSLIINVIMPTVACLQLTRALFLANIIKTKLRAGKIALEDTGLLFLLSEDKELHQRLGRIVIILLIGVNFIMATVSIYRIINTLYYVTSFILWLAIVLHLLLMLVGHFIFLIYNRSDLSFLKRFNI